MSFPEYIEKLISTAVTTTQDSGMHSIVLGRDEAQVKTMLRCADKSLGRARFCARQILVNGAALYTVTTGRPSQGMLWFIEAQWAEPDAIDECLSTTEKEVEYVWWPDRQMRFERVLFSDWLREYQHNTWRPVTLKGDLCVYPEPPIPADSVRTFWQVIMENE